MAKHFDLVIGEESFAFHRKAEAIAAEAAIDGIYVVRTSLPKKSLDAAATAASTRIVPSNPPSSSINESECASWRFR